MRYKKQIEPYYKPVEGEQTEPETGKATLLTFRRVQPVTAAPVPDGYGLLSEIAWAA